MELGDRTVQVNSPGGRLILPGESVNLRPQGYQVQGCTAGKEISPAQVCSER